jgi:SAM-dependent methyltransferase
VTGDDRVHWDDRYRAIGPAPDANIEGGAMFAPHEHLFPERGHALELACGRGAFAVWLARRGLEVWGLDVSPVAVDLARALAARHGVSARCRFDVADLDDAIPIGPPVDLVVCHFFRDARLDAAVVERLAPGGLLAIAVLSEVGAGPGPFRVAPGELHAAFEGLEAIASDERDGTAWLIARR